MKISEYLIPQLNFESYDYWDKRIYSYFRTCFSCKTCASECPVNIFTGQLNPTKIVRLFCLGFEDLLLNSPEIWYCIECGKCSNICPMNVKPHLIIKYARYKSIKNGIIAANIIDSISKIYLEFQKIRLQLLNKCVNEEDIPADNLLRNWDYLAQSVENDKKTSPIEIKEGFKNVVSEYKGIQINNTSCFTCRECSSSCPVYFNESIFDPVVIFRLFNLGLKDELVFDPMLWLCIGCETCTKVCSQGVKGHLIVKYLKEAAVTSHAVQKNFLLRWNKTQKDLFVCFTQKINSLIAQSYNK